MRRRRRRSRRLALWAALTFAAGHAVGRRGSAINVDKLAIDVWHAAQEPDVLSVTFPGFVREYGIGASAVADVAMAAVRKTLSSP